MRLDKGAVVLNSDVIRKQDHLRMNLDQTISLGLQIFLDHRSLSTTFNFLMVTTVMLVMGCGPGPQNRRTRRTCAEDQRKLGGPKSWLTKFSSLDS